MNGLVRTFIRAVAIAIAQEINAFTTLNPFRGALRKPYRSVKLPDTPEL